ncbi:MAG: hypothetical protein M3O36_11935, partial [Myxococcota bacterium]|nr:hypothetical protein [Myxococcota bacterium]
MKTFRRTVTVRGRWLFSLAAAGAAPIACGASPSTDVVAGAVADAGGAAVDDARGRDGVAP